MSMAASPFVDSRQVYADNPLHIFGRHGWRHIDKTFFLQFEEKVFDYISAGIFQIGLEFQKANHFIEKAVGFPIGSEARVQLELRDGFSNVGRLRNCLVEFRNQFYRVLCLYRLAQEAFEPRPRFPVRPHLCIEIGFFGQFFGLVFGFLVRETQQLQINPNFFIWSGENPQQPHCRLFFHFVNRLGRCRRKLRHRHLSGRWLHRNGFRLSVSLVQQAPGEERQQSKDNPFHRYPLVHQLQECIKPGALAKVESVA